MPVSTLKRVLAPAPSAAQSSILVLHLGRSPSASEFLPKLIGLQCILMWVRVQYFSRAFRQTRFEFMDTLMLVMKETWWYLAVMLLLMWGFAGCFFMIFRGQTDNPNTDQFSSLPVSLLTMFNYATGGTGFYVKGNKCILRTVYPPYRRLFIFPSRPPPSQPCCRAATLILRSLSALSTS